MSCTEQFWLHTVGGVKITPQGSIWGCTPTLSTLHEHDLSPHFQSVFMRCSLPQLTLNCLMPGCCIIKVFQHWCKSPPKTSICYFKCVCHHPVHCHNKQKALHDTALPNTSFDIEPVWHLTIFNAITTKQQLSSYIALIRSTYTNSLGIPYCLKTFHNLLPSKLSNASNKIYKEQYPAASSGSTFNISASIPSTPGALPVFKCVSAAWNSLAWRTGVSFCMF